MGEKNASPVDFILPLTFKGVKMGHDSKVFS